uniref:Dodecin family protein n=1 Tax=Roseihalotalea indica TaxID=2867963 RepID=A0AA49GT21_9BACT|nr:dodecin family protein [Tunicatimonas sp. TK19036]
MAVLKVIEILASSPNGWEDATKQGIQEASKSVKNIESAYVKEHSVNVENNQVTQYRVNLKITFRVES